MATGGTKSTLIDKKTFVCFSVVSYILSMRSVFVYFNFIFLCIGSVAQADVLRSTSLSYTMNTAVVKLHHLQNTQKKGLNYFITGGMTAQKKALIEQVLRTYGGAAFWVLTPSVVVQYDKQYIQLKLDDIHLVGGRYAWKSLPNTLSETGVKSVYQIADWVQHKIVNHHKNGSHIVIIDTPLVKGGLDIITSNRLLYNFAHSAGLDIAEIADPSPYKDMTQIAWYTPIFEDTEHTDEYDNMFNIFAFINDFYGVGHAEYSPWHPLQKGAVIDLVAPSSEYSNTRVEKVVQMLTKQGFQPRVKYLQQNPKAELYYSNTTHMRYIQLIEALNDPESKAVWVMRGGGGATNLLPYMLGTPRPKIVKPFIGFSDTTALHMFINTHWNMPTLHGIVAQYNRQMTRVTGGIVNKNASVNTILDILTGTTTQVTYTHLQPLNDAARSLQTLKTRVVGGNLTLVNTIFGTVFSVQNAYQPSYTLLLEGIGNGLHQTERMLDSIAYSPEMENIDAVLIGDLITYDKRMNTAEYQQLIEVVAARFAHKVSTPVFRIYGVGHGADNHPIPLNTDTVLQKSIDTGFSLTLQTR